MTDWKVLVPVEVLEGETIPQSVIDLLGTLPVVVLGYHVLPEQTPPGQARMQFEDRAQEMLDDLATNFSDAGRTAETRLVFTHDEEQTLDRVADETDCNAILIPNPAPVIERLLLPVGGKIDLERLTGFVASMIGDRPINVTVFHVAKSEADVEVGQSLVDDAVSRLRDRGLADTAIEREIVVSGTPVAAITKAAETHNAVAMGESAPSLRSFLFGEDAEQVAARSLGSVIVVRRERTAEPPGEDEPE